MRGFVPLVATCLFGVLTACSADQRADASCGQCALDARDTGNAGGDTADIPAACSPANCTGPGRSCRAGACVEDCRPADAVACAADTACDFTNGQCRMPALACFLPG